MPQSSWPTEKDVPTRPIERTAEAATHRQRFCERGMIRDGEIIDLIHLGFDPPIPLRFTRLGTGASIEGGRTGSHTTGHGENYWDKFKEVLDLGYIPVEDARSLNLVPANWQLPDIEGWTELISSSVRKGYPNAEQ